MSGETEEMSTFSGKEYDDSSKVIWNDDPEIAYFRQMVDDRQYGNADTGSLIGGSTLADMTEDGQNTLPTYDFRQVRDDRQDGNASSLIGGSSFVDMMEDGQNTLPTYRRPIVQLQGSTDLSLGEGTLDNIQPASKNRSFGWFTARGHANPGNPSNAKSPVSAVPSKFGGEIAETYQPNPSSVDDVKSDQAKVNVPNTIFVGGRPSAITTGGHNTEPPSGTPTPNKSKDKKPKPTPAQTRRRNWNCVKLIILFLTLCVVAAIVMLALTFTKRKDENSASSNEFPNDPSTLSPTFEVPTNPTDGPMPAPEPTVPTTPAPTQAPIPRITTSPIAPPVTTSAPTIAISTSTPGPTPAPTVQSTLAPVVNPTPAPVPPFTLNPLPTILVGGTTSPVLVLNPKDIIMADVSNQIVQLSPRSREALQTAGSPQYRALEWLVNEQIRSGSSPQNRALATTHGVDSKMLQRWILSTFYYSTLGDQWTQSGNWLTVSDECSWVSVDCSDDGDVEKLNLNRNNLSGELPLELSLLSSSLVSLPLASNTIGGTIPTEFGLLTKLERLQLTSNNVGGEIPSELGRLSNLGFLSFGRCGNIIGTLPTELGKLGALHTLDLVRNQITGRIPTEWGGMTQLLSLSLGENELIGTVPAQFGRFSALERLSVNNNYLTGEIPSEVCQHSQTIAVKADCLEVDCSCCVECCIDRFGCSVITSAPSPGPTRLPTSAPTPSPTPSPVIQPTARPTAAPTPKPTPRPSSFPTKAPTLKPSPGPTRLPTSAPTEAPTAKPTPGPTRPPTSAPTPSPTPRPTASPTTVPPTARPTASPTPNPTPRPSPTPTDAPCTTARVSGDKDCYSNSDDIIASFTNCNPAPDDWIGVYPASADSNDLGNPSSSSWVWACGTKLCDRSVDAGAVTFQNSGRVGEFKIFLIRRNSGGPYSAYAESESFEVGFSCATD